MQDQKHFEIVIADDGSRPETRAVIEDFSSKSAQNVKHIWHEDDGFRKTIILNKAVLATEADYLIFIDGDILVRSDFIDQHLHLRDWADTFPAASSGSMPEQPLRSQAGILKVGMSSSLDG